MPQMLGGTGPPPAAQQQRSNHMSHNHTAHSQSSGADLSALRVLPPEEAERWRATIL